MIALVIGGSGSGKSAYAEQMAVKAAGNGSLYYVATMQVYDEEGKKKVERHQKMRAGKGFLTIEQPRRLKEAAKWQPKECQPEKLQQELEKQFYWSVCRTSLPTKCFQKKICLL